MMRGWWFTMAVAVPMALASQAHATRLTVTSTRAEVLYSQTDEPDCSDLHQRASADLPLSVVRLSVEGAPTDGSIRYRWVAPKPNIGVFAADLDLGPSDQTRLIRSFATELGNPCVLTGESLALYDRPTILWIAPTCDVLPDDTSKPFNGDRVTFGVQALQGKRHVGKGSVAVGYGRLASATMLVADAPYDNFRDGRGKPDGEKIFINVAFGATTDYKGATLPAVTQFEYNSGDGNTVSDNPPCDEPGINQPSFASCLFPPLYDSGGKHKAVLRVDFEDGSALCDALMVNVRTAPLVFDVDVSTKPNRSTFVPGDPKSGSPVLTVRARNKTAPGTVGGNIVLAGNVLSCDTEAKVGGTTLTRTTQIDLQHCSATVTQPCDNDGDCDRSRCPTCEALEKCLTADHCSQSKPLGCANDRDCQPPRCPRCQPDETCVKVLSRSTIFIAPGDAVDLIDSPIPLINVLTTPAKIKETWTAHSFNAGDATAKQRYAIKPRPDVKPATR